MSRLRPGAGPRAPRRCVRLLSCRRLQLSVGTRPCHVTGELSSLLPRPLLSPRLVLNVQTLKRPSLVRPAGLTRLVPEAGSSLRGSPGRPCGSAPLPCFSHRDGASLPGPESRVSVRSLLPCHREAQRTAVCLAVLWQASRPPRCGVGILRALASDEKACPFLWGPRGPGALPLAPTLPCPRPAVPATSGVTRCSSTARVWTCTAAARPAAHRAWL